MTPFVVVAMLNVSPKMASAADAPLAVLGIEASEAPDTLATSLTDALRQRVSASKGFRLVPGRDLVEVKLVFSCPDEAPSCMAQAGKSLGASKLIFGSVKKSVGDSYLVTLKLLDTNRAVVDAFVAEQITKAQTAGPAVRGPVQKWFAALTGQGGAGTVRVHSDVIGASVALDGSPAGILGTEDLVIAGVAPGKHEINVTKPGYEPVHNSVNVASGETAQVSVQLLRSAGSAPVGTIPSTGITPRADRLDSDSRMGLKTATWAVAGAGLVGLVLGVKFGLDVQSINSDLDDLRRFPCSIPPYFQCNANNQPAKPLRQDQRDYVDAKKEDGQRLETYQYISYGLGGALLLTSGYLFYRAYLQDEGGTRRAKTPSSFVLLPLLGPSQAGLGAHLGF